MEFDSGLPVLSGDLALWRVKNVGRRGDELRAFVGYTVGPISLGRHQSGKEPAGCAPLLDATRLRSRALPSCAGIG